MNAYINAKELMEIAPRGYTLEKLAIKKPADLGNRQARG